MKLIKPSASLLNVSHIIPSHAVDSYGRTCYKSKPSLNSENWSRFIRARIADGHESVIEHVSATVEVICDRGVSHEIVRHRLASYSQESTRYCNYGSDHITFIIPPWVDLPEGVYVEPDMIDPTTCEWAYCLLVAEHTYKNLLAHGWKAQQARSVLPNSLKTELIWTANVREWRKIFSLRCDKPAHPQMREIMIPLLSDFYEKMPDFFFDLYDKFCGGSNERKESTGLA